MYKIKWRRPPSRYGTPCQTITGLSIYENVAKAQAQIDVWKQYFRQNTYYIVATI